MRRLGCNASPMQDKLARSPCDIHLDGCLDVRRDRQKQHKGDQTGVRDMADIDDAVARSKSVSSDSVVDSWICQADVSAFEIIIESIASGGSGVELRKDVTFLTLQSTDLFPSGPHLLS